MVPDAPQTSELFEVKTPVAQRLEDEGLIMPARAAREIQETRTQERKVFLLDTLIKGYRFNPFNNRGARRFSAKSNGYLRRDEKGQTDWWRFRASGTNVQTVVNNG